MTRDDKLRWAAGFLDGEGWFCITKRRTFQAQVGAAQKVDTPLLILQELFGGSITNGSYSSSFGKSTMYQWQVTGDTMLKACEELLPFLILKKEQVQCVVELQRTVVRGQKVVPEEVLMERALLAVRCEELNHKEVS